METVTTQIITKNDKAFKDITFKYISSLMHRLRDKGWSRDSQERNFVAAIAMDSSTYPYCWDSIQMIQRFLSDDNWKLTMKNYHLSDDCKHKLYTWWMERKK